MDFNFMFSGTVTFEHRVIMPGLEGVFREALSELREINRRLVIMSVELDDLAAAVTEETTVVTSIETLITSLAAQITASAGDPAKITALAAELRANTARLAAAVTANTPPAPPTP